MSIRLTAHLLLLIGSLAWAGYPAHAKGLTFGMAGKSHDDENFVAAWQGCDEEAKKHGDRCLNIGRPGPTNSRAQDLAILDALEQPLAGLAVSVTHSELLAASSLARLAAKSVPLITFDSDLDAPYQHLRRSYIGPNSVDFGRELARLAMERNPKGGVLCILGSDPNHPNLIQRQTGLRQVLSGDPAWPVDTKLTGQNGWTEHARCPWNNGDDITRALKQMKVSLSELKADAVIAIGQWPVIEPDLYRQAIGELKEPGIGMRVTVGIGLASPARVQLLQDGLVQGYVSIDFVEMGRASYRTMKALAKGRKVAPRVLTSLLIYKWGPTRQSPGLKVRVASPSAETLTPSRSQASQ